MLNKHNKTREEPIDYLEGKSIYMQIPKRNNKLTLKFKKTKFVKQNKVTVIDLKNRKLHKQKLKRPLKMSDSS